jgi:uncharacterized protein YoxC
MGTEEAIDELKQTVKFWMKVFAIVGPALIFLVGWILSSPISHIYEASEKLGKLSGVPDDVRQLQSQTADIREKLVALAPVPAKVDGLAQLPTKIDDLEKRVAEIAKTIDSVKGLPAAVDGFKTALEKTDRELRAAAGGVGELKQAIAALSDGQAKLKAEIANARTDLEDRLNEAKARKRFLVRVPLKEPASEKKVAGGTEFTFRDKESIAYLRALGSAERGLVVESVEDLRVPSQRIPPATMNATVENDDIVVVLWIRGDEASIRAALSADSLAINVRLVQR